MKTLNKLPIFNLIIVSFFFFSTASAQDYSELITEEYLRSEFTFKKEDKLKYDECKKKTYPTCKYVWGKEYQKLDAMRAKMGVAPQGDTLIVIYAQASELKDFEQAIAVYKDAKEIAGIGVKAVWSSPRKQLSFITDKNLIIHVNLVIKGLNRKVNVEKHTINIAKYLITKL